jgi:hypothetical protein
MGPAPITAPLFRFKHDINPCSVRNIAKICPVCKIYIKIKKFKCLTGLISLNCFWSEIITALEFTVYSN